MPNKLIFVLSLPLTAFTILVSCVGLYTPHFYSAETINWQAQSMGQDMVDLFLVTPCLLITSFFAYRNNRAATMMWGGVVLYHTYTFVLYCFDVHFNKLFVLYCLCLGLSFYSLMYFLLTHFKENNIQLENRNVARFVGIYFIIIAILFYCLWMLEIVPAIIQNRIPKSLTDTGLFTNGVQVIDLAVILPGIFITGILLLKRVSFGFILAPIFLTFFVLMDITIGALVVVMKINGIESDLMLAVIMGALALFSLVLLIWYFKNIHPKNAK